MKTIPMKYLILLLGIPLIFFSCSQYLSMEGTGDIESFLDDDHYDTNGDDDVTDGEKEETYLKVMPRAVDKYVFVANPERDTVSKIDVSTLEITTIDVEDQPTWVLTSDDQQIAVVFNEGADSVSIIDVHTNEVTSVDVREDFNYIVLSGDGRFTIVYFNASLEDADFDVEGVRSYSEISVVNNTTFEVTSFAVGFNPKDITFTDDNSIAVVISDEMLAIVYLTLSPITFDIIDLVEDPLNPSVAEEVEVSPIGDYAFIRNQNSKDLVVVDIPNLEVAGKLGAEVEATDIDLDPSGQKLYSVLKDSNKINVYRTEDPFAPPHSIHIPSTETVGQITISSDGTLAILFTTSTLVERYTVLDIETGRTTVKNLVKPVRSLYITPDSRTAVFFHSLLDDPYSEHDVFSDEWVMSLVNLENFLTNPVILESEIDSYAESDDGDYGFIIMKNNRNVGIIDFSTLLVDDVKVPSKPVYIGVMPAKHISYVSQEHELGRISFIDPDKDPIEITTITGFELNSEIEYE